MLRKLRYWWRGLWMPALVEHGPHLPNDGKADAAVWLQWLFNHPNGPNGTVWLPPGRYCTSNVITNVTIRPEENVTIRPDEAT